MNTDEITNYGQCLSFVKEMVKNGYATDEQLMPVPELTGKQFIC